MDDESKVCGNCSHALSADDTTCPECGQEVEPAGETSAPEQPEPDKNGTNSRSRVVLVVVGAVVLGLIIGAGAWLLNRPESQTSKQYDASAAELTTMLTDMSGVQTTQMVRDVAAGAAPQIETIDTTLEANPQLEDANQLATMRDAFTDIAALTAYTQDDTKVWAKNRQPLIDNLNTLTSYGGATAQASATGDGAVRALDELTAQVDAEMAKYRKQLEQFREKARGLRYDLDSYYMQVEPLIEQEAEIDRQTDAYLKRLRNKEVFMFEVMAYFSEVAADRQAIADQMAGIYAPADFYDVNANLSLAMTELADSSEDAVTALQDADCDYGTCYFEWDKAWKTILPGSPETNADYREAERAWQSAILTVEEQITGESRPKEPEL